MHHITTAALVVIAGCAMSLAWNFGAFTQAFIEFTKRPLNTNVLFNPEIVELIRNWRRSPRAKKEVV